MIDDSVEDATYGVLVDTSIHALSRKLFVERCSKIFTTVDVVAAQSMQVLRSRDVAGHNFGNLVNGIVFPHVMHFDGIGFHGGNGIDYISNVHEIIGDFEISGILRMRCTYPCVYPAPP